MIDNLKVIFKNLDIKIKNKFFFCISLVFISSFIEIDSQHHSASKLLASQNRSVIRLTGLMPTHLLVV